MNDTGHELQEVLHREVGTLDLRTVVRVPAGASLSEVATRLLRDEDVSSVLVGDKPREIVTERDLTQALAKGLGPATPVEDIAERTPVWVTTTSEIADVATLMLHHEVRHIIVLAPSGDAVGVLSMRDIFSLLLPARTPYLPKS